MKTYLSGIQPSGLLHIGNYFGAIRQHVALQEEAGEHFYFIADYHALTTVQDAAKLRELVFETAVTYLALGLDPSKVALFRQSDVPEVQELTWLLSTVTGMGLLERAHSYKDKIANGIKPSVGLFTYPILMAADILAYDTDVVPVGKDQVQHVEMTQDMAGYFNGTYGGEVFKRPEMRLEQAESMQKVPGLDGQKMSKSYGNDVWIFESGKKLKKRFGKLVTDSRPPEEPKDPEELSLFELMALFVDASELADWKDKVRNGGDGAPGYGQLKGRIAEAMDAYFTEARERRESLLADPSQVEEALQRGAAIARARAQSVRDRAYAACGLRPPLVHLGPLLRDLQERNNPMSSKHLQGSKWLIKKDGHGWHRAMLANREDSPEWTQDDATRALVESLRRYIDSHGSDGLYSILGRLQSDETS